MGMLNKEDLRQIGEVMDEKLVTFGKVLKKEIVEEIVPVVVDQVVAGVGEIIDEGILPQIAKLDSRITKIEATMVTKDYLDEKLGVTNGNVSRLVNVLQEKRVITEDDKVRILA